MQGNFSVTIDEGIVPMNGNWIALDIEHPEYGTFIDLHNYLNPDCLQALVAPQPWDLPDGCLKASKQQNK